MLRKCVRQQLLARGLRTLSGSRKQQLRRDPQSPTRDSQLDNVSPVPQSRATKTNSKSPKEIINKSGYLYGTDYDAKLIQKMLEAAETSSDLDEGFWSAVARVAKDRQAREGRHLDLFVRLFETAKNEEDPLLRQQYVYIVGKYIYNARKVRLDPVNEVVYLDSLVASGRAFEALRLWRSRVGRDDVKHSTYWPEVGVLYHIDANLPFAAHKLALSQDYVPPRVALALIDAFARRPVGENLEKLEHWVDFVTSQPIAEKVRFKKKMTIEQKLQLVLPFNIGDFHEALRTLIRRQQWYLAGRIVEKLDSDQIDVPAVIEEIYNSRPPKTLHRKNAKFVPDSIYSILLPLKNHDECYDMFPETLIAVVRNVTAIDGNVDVLESEILSSRVRLSDRQKAQILSRLLSRVECKELGLELAEDELKGPTSAAVLAKSLPHDERAEYLRTYSGPMDSSLALVMLKAGNPANLPLEKLGLSQACWRYVWYAVCRNPETAPPQLRRLVRNTFASENFEVTLSALEAILQALITVDGDIAGVAGVLHYVKQAHGYDVPFPLVKSIVTVLRKAVKGDELHFAKPSRGDVTFDEYDGPTVTWEIVAQKLLRSSDYDGTIEDLTADANRFASTLPLMRE